MGIGKAFRYLVTHPEKYEFEAKNPSTLFVALSRAKSASRRGSDPDFAFHEDVLLNDEILKLIKTPHYSSKTNRDAKAALAGYSISLFHKHIKMKHL